MKDDVKKYLRIMRLIKSRQTDKLSKEDYNFFTKFSFEVDDEAIKKLQESDDFKGLSEEDISDGLQNIYLQAAQDPDLKEKLLESAEGLERSDLAEKITTALNIGLAGADIATSVGQIQAANKASNNLRRPTAPAPLAADPKLEAALAEAERGKSLEATRSLSPAQLQILDQYLSDLNTAKTVSGGQAGAYGSLAQVASTRRSKAAGELVPLYDDLVRRGEQRYDQLLSQKLQENQAIQESKSRYYPYNLDSYNKEAQTAAILGSVGRSNLRSSVGALAGFLPDVVSRLSTRKRFRDIYSSMLPYGEENAKSAANADYKLYNPEPSYDAYDPAYQSQIESIYGGTLS